MRKLTKNSLRFGMVVETEVYGDVEFIETTPNGIKIADSYRDTQEVYCHDNDRFTVIEK